jgi:hypothetical protein
MEKLEKSLEKFKKQLEQGRICTINKNLSVDAQALSFNTMLHQIIKPKSVSDRTCFRRITNWLLRGVKEGKFTPEVFEIVLGFAAEAAGPDSRNPAAVFMKILKDELHYGKNNT